MAAKAFVAAAFNSTSNPTTRDEDGHKYDAVPGTPDHYRYSRLSNDYSQETHGLLEGNLRHFRKNNKRRLFVTAMGALGVFLFFSLAVLSHTQNTTQSCDTVNGFTCQPGISQLWGQQSPYFSVPSNISASVPDQCTITFAQILSRHGARDPTAGKTAKYKALVDRIHSTATSFSNATAFIKDYQYTLGADQLTTFGQQELVNSGIKFYNRYKSIAQTITPFIRSSGQDRVIESAQNWTQGFHAARFQDTGVTDDGFPYKMVIISEEKGSNNTLNHDLCTAFEEGPDNDIGDSAQAIWTAVFMPNITARLNKQIPGVNFTDADSVIMMDLCPFNTVASDVGTISPFCDLFTQAEWQSYNYLQTIGKYYSYSWGNPLAPTQGVGFTNELLARMTNTPVIDHTSTNSTLDSSNETFPIGPEIMLYADFTHDNDMTTIFSAMGLYNSTAPLLNTTIQNEQETKGYSASFTVPFSARAYFEKMQCVGASEELVRVVVNDRVLPLEMCGGDALGRCGLSKFVGAMSFAQAGGNWDSCFL